MAIRVIDVERAKAQKLLAKAHLLRQWQERRPRAGIRMSLDKTFVLPRGHQRIQFRPDVVVQDQKGAIHAFYEIKTAIPHSTDLRLAARQLQSYSQMAPHAICGVVLPSEALQDSSIQQVIAEIRERSPGFEIWSI